MLLDFFTWYFEKILSDQKPPTEDDFPLQCIALKIYLAERGPLNILNFQNMLHQRFRDITGNYKEKWNLSPDRQPAFHAKCYLIPASHSPFIQVSDLLCYMIRGYLNGASMHESMTTWLNIVPCQEFEIPGKLKKRRKLQDLCRQMTGIAVSDPMQVPPLPTAPPRPVELPRPSVKPRPIRAPEDFAQSLLGRVASLWQGGTREVDDKELDQKIAPLMDRLMGKESWRLITELEQVRLIAHEKIQVHRQFIEGALLVRCLQKYIEKARAAACVSTSELDRLERQCAVLYLAAHNHQGHFCLDDPCIVKAVPIANDLCRDMAHWSLVCDFHNNMAVTRHNVFDFTGAAKDLHPMVEELERRLKNPFQGASLKSYEIGAMFGTYAQTLAFETHCGFFNHGNATLVLNSLSDSEYYSELAREHFVEPKDHERQITYQAHFLLQAYILTENSEKLAAAGELLDRDAETHQAMEAFLSRCPERDCLVPAYRVTVVLKHDYLARRKSPWTKT